MPSKSEMMNQLYGPKIADKVYNRLQELDPLLNEEIQRVAYDHYWALPGLSTKDKSLVTVVSLIAMGKEEQTRIHINGFLNAQGTIEELRATLELLAESDGRDKAVNGEKALIDVLKERNLNQDDTHQLESAQNKSSSNEAGATKQLEKRQKQLVQIAAAVAVGNQQRTKKILTTGLMAGLALDDIRNTLIHQIVYCGFPASMNGFAALREVLTLNAK